eukprot:Hpha_TRINITY_DN15179_c0_g2::TRINITY_DN15179_c0_g2_i1::g.126671::m.126671
MGCSCGSATKEPPPPAPGEGEGEPRELQVVESAEPVAERPRGAQGRQSRASSLGMSGVRWSCEACTYANREARRTCRICKTPRDGLQWWVCAVCTRVSSERCTSCAICGARRDAFGGGDSTRPPSSPKAATPKHLPAALRSAVAVDDLGDSMMNCISECCVCLLPLCSRPISCFGSKSDQGSLNRTCGHLVHQDCAEALRKRECPLCTVAFTSVLSFPDPVTDPSGG